MVAELCEGIGAVPREAVDLLLKGRGATLEVGPLAMTGVGFVSLSVIVL